MARLMKSPAVTSSCFRKRRLYLLVSDEPQSLGQSGASGGPCALDADHYPKILGLGTLFETKRAVEMTASSGCTTNKELIAMLGAFR